MLETKRLRLRRWMRRDVAAFAYMNADAKVMAYFPALLTPMQSLAAIDKFEQNFNDLGYSFWAVEFRDTLEFVGSVGLEPYLLPAAATASVAIGWQLVSKFWGLGLAREAAQAVLEDATERLHLPEVIALTHDANRRSVRLCKQLGMQCVEARAVDDATLPTTHPLRRKLLFRKALRETIQN
jgi:RimJ/RimL family protein N-acetyltransferase